MMQQGREATASTTPVSSHRSIFLQFWTWSLFLGRWLPPLAARSLRLRRPFLSRSQPLFLNGIPASVSHHAEKEGKGRRSPFLQLFLPAGHFFASGTKADFHGLLALGWVEDVLWRAEAPAVLR